MAWRRSSLALFVLVPGAALVLALLLALASDISLSWLTGPEAGPLDFAVDALGEILVAVLGITLTVVAIVVQLASQRYSAKVVDLFMRDGVNIGVFSFMVAVCVYVVVLPAMGGTGGVPVAAAVAAIALAVVDLAVLLPYFAYVFEFLQPDGIVARIERDARRSCRASLHAAGGAALEASVAGTAESVERIADNCVVACGQSDRNLALLGVRALERITTGYADMKSQLPAKWFAVPSAYLPSLSEEFLDSVRADGTWVEAKVMLEYEHVLRRASGTMNELATQIATSTRHIGERALSNGDDATVELVIRFFNTFIRSGMTARNVRVVYNVLAQYRAFAEGLVGPRFDMARRIADHLVYYGRLANGAGLPFVTVTAAHDLRQLCELAFAEDPQVVGRLVDAFLTLDEPPDGDSQEAALMGVRKAQSILGAALLAAGADELVERIRKDLSDESPRRLLRIRREILSVTNETFWEITDRGFNFDYVDPVRRPWIEAFFAPIVDTPPTNTEMHPAVR